MMYVLPSVSREEEKGKERGREDAGCTVLKTLFN